MTSYQLIRFFAYLITLFKYHRGNFVDCCFGGVRCVQFLFDIKDIFKFRGISKSVYRLYSKCFLDSLEQSLYFRNVSQEYGMYNDDIHYVPEKFNRYLTIKKKRIYGQIRICCFKQS